MEKNGEDTARTALLLALVREGDSDAFTGLEELYAPLLRKMERRYSVGLCEVDAKEVRQETIIAFYRAACHYNPSSKASFGLFAKICIRNALTSLYRKRQHSPALSWEMSDEAAAETVEEPVASLINREDEAKVLSRADAVLSSYEKQIFRLYREGYRASAIAARVGRSEKSVNNAISRMKQKLQREFDSQS